MSAQVVRFEAAKPVGVNELYRPGQVFGPGGTRRLKIRKSEAGEAFGQRLLLAARAVWRRLGLESLGGTSKRRVPVSVSIWMTFETYANDIDGPIKPILDSLQAAKIVFNDNRIDELHVYRRPPDRARPRVEVVAHELEQDEAS